MKNQKIFGFLGGQTLPSDSAGLSAIRTAVIRACLSAKFVSISKKFPFARNRFQKQTLPLI
ncbi:Uncharacterized protein dnm_080760 [Desulfonema magnum]|uniref:Uncharacterized protein n=1 Tax=Desulfonema magnum TaxID=45655 RepID=A0A975BUR4_9BACT|nr:Uncharacterized protein dnm_080760 [Desulfonema magnum]